MSPRIQWLWRTCIKGRTGRVIATLLAASVVAGCGKEEPRATSSSTANAPVANVAATGAGSGMANRGYDFATVMRGGKLFAENCAQCHGALAQGAPQWQRPGPDRKYPAPPLNGTGHAWHHPTEVLKSTVRNGTLRIGGSMPAWGDKLTDADIEAIIAWFQSHWPEEIYVAWKRMDDKARTGGPPK